MRFPARRGAPGVAALMTASLPLPPPQSPPPSSPLERLYRATTAISATVDDEGQLLQTIVEQLATLLDARYAALGLLGEHGDLISFETRGLTPEELGSPCSPSRPSAA